MAKYITVICRVKGETVLKLIDDFDSVEDNVFYYKDCPQNQFDLSLVKQEVEEEETKELNEFNHNSCNSQESEDYFDERNAFNHFWDDVHSGDNTDDNQSMDSHKKYLSVIKTSGRQMFYCRYENCEYQTLWKNAIVNHIRSNHLFFFPFVCGESDCDKKFAIRSNLNNHQKVHSKRSFKAFKANIEESSQSSADIDHSYSQHKFSQNLVKKRNPFTQRSNKFSSIRGQKTTFAQNISKSKKKFAKQKSKKRNQRNAIKNINEESNHSVDGSKDEKHCSDQTPAFVGIQSVAQFIRQTEKNGKIWRICLFENCSYESRYSTSMVYHIRNNHLNDKPYVCSLCEKRFAMRTNLNNHKKVHQNKN